MTWQRCTLILMLLVTTISGVSNIDVRVLSKTENVRETCSPWM